jgi:hypothetical protein
MKQFLSVKCGLIHVLVELLFSHQAHTWPFVDQLSHSEKM